MQDPQSILSNMLDPKKLDLATKSLMSV